MTIILEGLSSVRKTICEDYLMDKFDIERKSAKNLGIKKYDAFIKQFDTFDDCLWTDFACTNLVQSIIDNKLEIDCGTEDTRLVYSKAKKLHIPTIIVYDQEDWKNLGYTDHDFQSKLLFFANTYGITTISFDRSERQIIKQLEKVIGER